MEMSVRTFFSCAALWLISSCAQVGYLTGGDKDEIAPEPIKSLPVNKSTSFNGREIKWYFDEFIQLQDPQHNIIMVPNDAKLNAMLKNKTLTIHWEENLQPNTTYVIYSNKAVTDASEGNGTLFNYVFSTGTQLDTITRAFRINNTITNSVASKTTVGLFTRKDSIKPLYFSNSKNSGIAELRYLKEGYYNVRAFQDENNDLIIGSSEVCGFITDSVYVSPTYTDTLEIQLFKPLTNRFIDRFEYKAPGLFEIELVQPLPSPLFLMNDKPVYPEHIRRVTDKIYRLLPVDSIHEITKLNLIVDALKDSTTLKTSLKERITSLTIRISGKSFPLEKSVIFELNSEIREPDTSKIQIYSSEDSTKTIPYSVEFKKDQLYIKPAISNGGQFRIHFSEGAINSSSKNCFHTFELKAKKELGTFQLQPEGFNCPLIIELLKNNTLVDQRILSAGQNLIFEDLIPDEYTYRIIEDLNGNGVWDTGNLNHKLQPEKIRIYDVPVRIRPNWEVKQTIKAHP